MKIVAITRALNEADIIEAFARHTAAFVQHHIFMDNGSSDGTVEILAALKQEGLPITVFQSRAVTFNEGNALTYMYNVAMREHAPDWVFCLDADEFIDDRALIGGARAYLEQLMGAVPPVEVVKIPMVNYFATSQDDHAEAIVPVRITKRRPPSDAHKIILRGGLPEADIVIEHGSHWAWLRSRQINGVMNNDLWLAHYSERSPFQYIAKFVRGWSKVLASGQAEVGRKTAYHYHDPFDFLRDKPANFLRNPRFMGFKNEVPDLIDDPARYCGGALRYTASVDEAMRAVRALMGYLDDLATQHGRLIDEFPFVKAQVQDWESQINKLF
ncbi:glycosyltransferase family 2 protein [Acidocella sp.]|uniref:glycosyltransferase family 2 protein n=1 Tax=Acidocella sp. TaxID=50710 RepID=UPI0026089893|nr:glycosyltransferase family 2 protein [Acidocella sp.]